MKNKNFTSIGFILGLTILLFNDFYLKNHYGNWITGKISDFAGLFIFPMFWTILFPKFKYTIYIITAIIFIYWKSVYSQPLIDFTNQSSIFSFRRTVDYTDLLALLILPISYFYHQDNTNKFFKINPTFIIVLTSFSFIATSYSSDVEYTKTYSFNFSVDSLKFKIYYLKTIQNNYEKEKRNYILDSTGKYKIHKFYWDTIDAYKPPIDKFVTDTMSLFVFDDDICFEGYDANLMIIGDSLKSAIKVRGFHHVCRQERKATIIESFEQRVIERLK